VLLYRTVISREALHLPTMELPSKSLADAVDQLASLPGVGKKTALRYAMHLLQQNASATLDFADSIKSLKENTRFCKVCHNIANNEICKVCASTKRDQTTLCIVEDALDVISIENTQQYNGLYHVLGGIISPMEGIGPSELHIDSLIERIENNPEINELIFALSTTTEGDTTNFFIFKKVSRLNRTLKTSTLARGVSIGNELEYTDELTLGRSILHRTPYENSLKR